MKKRIIVFAIVILFFLLTSCNKEKEGTTIYAIEYPLTNEQIKEAIDSGNLKDKFSFYHYSYQGKIINISSEYIDFQNGDLVTRTKVIKNENNIKLEKGHSYAFAGVVIKYDYDALYMSINIKEEISEYHVLIEKHSLTNGTIGEYEKNIIDHYERNKDTQASHF